MRSRRRISKLLFQNTPEGTEGNHENLSLGGHVKIRNWHFTNARLETYSYIALFAYIFLKLIVSNCKRKQNINFCYNISYGYLLACMNGRQMGFKTVTANHQYTLCVSKYSCSPNH
jgi:hypothetical protein